MKVHKAKGEGSSAPSCGQSDAGDRVTTNEVEVTCVKCRRRLGHFEGQPGRWPSKQQHP